MQRALTLVSQLKASEQEILELNFARDGAREWQIAKTASEQGIEPSLRAREVSLAPAMKTQRIQRGLRVPSWPGLFLAPQEPSELAGETAALHSRRLVQPGGEGGGETVHLPSREVRRWLPLAFPSAHKYVSLNWKPKTNSSFAAGCHYVMSHSASLGPSRRAHLLPWSHFQLCSWLPSCFP